MGWNEGADPLPMPHERHTRLLSRRPNTSSRRGLLAALLAALLPHPAATAVTGTAARRSKRKQNKKKARERVNECVRTAPPQICNCNPWASALCGQCWEAVSGCCSQMQVSRVAGCTCLYTTGWGSCVR